MSGYHISAIRILSLARPPHHEAFRVKCGKDERSIYLPYEAASLQSQQAAACRTRVPSEGERDAGRHQRRRHHQVRF